VSRAEKTAIVIATYAVENTDDAFILTRNGQPVKTPAGGAYRLPTRALAEAVAAEWRAQGAKPQPATMPLTQLAATALDLLPQKREAIVNQLIAYATSELLCHRVEVPAALARQQQEVWQPYLDWCALRFDALLLVSKGVMPITQPPETLKALRQTLSGYADFPLSGLSAAVDACGSLVLGLALAERHQSAAFIFAAAELDASYQMDRWGQDPDIIARHASLRRELEACEQWFAGLVPLTQDS